MWQLSFVYCIDYHFCFLDVDRVKIILFLLVKIPLWKNRPLLLQSSKWRNLSPSRRHLRVSQTCPKTTKLPQSNTRYYLKMSRFDVPVTPDNPRDLVIWPLDGRRVTNQGCKFTNIGAHCKIIGRSLTEFYWCLVVNQNACCRLCSSIGQRGWLWATRKLPMLFLPLW